MKNEDIQWLFGIHDYTFQVNTEGVTHDESLVRSETGGNCMNWVIGHLLNSRQGILRTLDKQWTIPEATNAVYERGAKGDDYNLFLPMERLKELWGESQGLLMATLDEMSPEKFAEITSPVGLFKNPDTRERRMFFLYFHESYHLGQLGLMRRLLGKQGAIQ